MDNVFATQQLTFLRKFFVIFCWLLKSHWALLIDINYDMRITILALCARSCCSYVDIGTYMILESSKLIFNWTAYFSLILLLLILRVRDIDMLILSLCNFMLIFWSLFYVNFSLSPYHSWNLPWKLNNASTEAIISHCNCPYYMLVIISFAYMPILNWYFALAARWW